MSRIFAVGLTSMGFGLYRGVLYPLMHGKGAKQSGTAQFSGGVGDLCIGYVLSQFPQTAIVGYATLFWGGSNIVGGAQTKGPIGDFIHNTEKRVRNFLRI